MEKFLELGLVVLVVLVALHFGSSWWGSPATTQNLIEIILLVFPLLLCAVHCCCLLGLRRGVVFILLATGIGWTFETIGLTQGVLFGGQYLYNEAFVNLGRVPWVVVLYWGAFIYNGYSIVNFWLLLLAKEKPNLKNKNWKWLPVLILLDGYIVTAIDLFMDPIQVQRGAWTWLQGGPYFGVPIGNFVGWFLVASLVTMLFRSIEYFFPVPQQQNQQDKVMQAMPLVSYSLLLVSFLTDSSGGNLYPLQFYGTFFMGIVLVITVILGFKASLGKGT